MRRLAPLILLLGLVPRAAWGHPMPNSAVVLRFQPGAVDLELTLPVSELAIGWDQPLPPDADRVTRDFGAKLEDYVLAHVHATTPDGRPWTVTIREMTPVEGTNPDVRVDLMMTPPPGAPLDRLTLRYDVIFHHLITHSAIVMLAGDWGNGVLGDEPVLLGTLRDTSPDLVIDRSGGSWARGFAAMFRLGTRHIAEGTDHLLFLLALILPAPLVAAGGRWGGCVGGSTACRRIIQVVTAFTVGHSVTLVLGALGWVRLPVVVVESAIALSILVSAVHALIPIFRGKEVAIAGGFGLMHGLAFAATLTDFGLDRLILGLSILGFNLGIEAAQILLILLVMPCLVVLARTWISGTIRTVGAVLIGIAAVAWFTERALGWSNPINGLVEGLAAHPWWLLVGLVGLTVAATIADRKSPARHLQSS